MLVLVAVAAEVEIAVAGMPRASWLMPAALFYTLPLLLRGRWPFAMPTLVIVVQVVVSFVDVPGGRRENWGVVAYVLAMWAFGAYNRLRLAVAGLVVALAGIVVVTVEDVRVPADEALSVALIGSLTWLAGVVLRRRSRSANEAVERAAALERERRDAEVAVAEERARIARELHDVVAHSVSVMTVQAGAARMLLKSDPERAVAPLLAVEETGRQALAELRRLLRALPRPARHRRRQRVQRPLLRGPTHVHHRGPVHPPTLRGLPLRALLGEHRHVQLVLLARRQPPTRPPTRHAAIGHHQ